MKEIKTTKTEIKFIDREFSVNPQYVQERTGNYELRDKIASKWDNSKYRTDGNGNVHHNFCFDISKQTFCFSENGYTYNDGNYMYMHRIISPALLLYRLIATFFASPVCEDGYKLIWEYNLIHKKSGVQISFSEWKGAVGFWLAETDYRKLSADLQSDLIDLMNYLISNECAHPYDGLVAGSVA